MKKLISLSVIIFTLSFVFSSVAYAAPGKNKTKDPKVKNSCLTCHTENENLPEDFKKYDIHLSVGLTCADCHGGDPTSDDDAVAMSKKKGFIGVPSKKDIPKLCGKCHSDIRFMRKYNPRMETDQVSQYYTSVHGMQLKKGNTDVAACTDCHTAHAILPPSDPRSTVYAVNVPETCNKCHGNKKLAKKYGLDPNVYNDFKASVHGKDLLEKKDTGAPACNDCHGNHGAVPPGVKSIELVCGECHVNNMNFFVNSKMGKAWQELGYHGCVECHSNHKIIKPKDDFVGTSDKSFCMKCHDEGDDGYNVAKSIHQNLTRLDTLIKEAKVKLAEVRQKGMDDLDISYSLKEAHQAIVQSRTEVHTFDSTKVKKKIKPGIQAAKKAILKANSELKEYTFRRNGYAAATLVFLVFIVLFYLKIRKKE